MAKRILTLTTASNVTLSQDLTELEENLENSSNDVQDTEDKDISSSSDTSDTQEEDTVTFSSESSSEFKGTVTLTTASSIPQSKSTSVVTPPSEEDTSTSVKISNSVLGVTVGHISNLIPEVVPTPRKPSNDRYRRIRRSNFQARLGRKLDRINGKIIDNDIRLTAHPTDMIRVEAIRDERSHDLISRVIKTTEVMPILLPKMEDIPLRHLVRDNEDVLVPALYSIAQEEFFEVYAPVECDLNEDDLLVRILYDSSPEIEDPYVMVFQVKEVLGTFGYSSLLWKKCLVTFYDEALPEQVVRTLQQTIKKRETLNW